MPQVELATFKAGSYYVTRLASTTGAIMANRKTDVARKFRTAFSWLSEEMIAALCKKLTMRELQALHQELSRVPRHIIKLYAQQMLKIHQPDREELLQDDAA